MKEQGFSLRFIAITMNRSVSTISREISRNTGLKGYRPKQANGFSQARHQQKHKHIKLTKQVKDYITQKLKLYWSPEQIVLRLCEDNGISIASMLILLESCGEIKKREVLGIDIDIRAHNKKAIEGRPMSKKITMFEGSSISDKMISKVHEFAKRGKKILVCLDSNHTHKHVLAELNAYASLASVGSYCIVFDTLIEDMPQGFYDRTWDKGDNPKTAVWEYLKTHSEFEIDENIQNKLLITVAPDGYLKRKCL